MHPDDLAPAPLSDPLYYLHNAQAWLRWCLEQHADLLAPEEISTLQRLLTLDTPSQALLIRMAMRKGDLFRQDALRYAEVPDLPQALAQLAAAHLIDLAPRLSIAQLVAQCRRQECLQLARQLLPNERLLASSSKTRLLARLSDAFDATITRPLDAWWSDPPFRLLQLSIMPLLDRLRLMFFGNLQQDLSEFVLTELGLQQYEPVPLGAESRAFQHRVEVDHYLALHQLQQALGEGQPVDSLIAQLPSASDNAWLAQRRQRLLFQLGREAERAGAAELALDCYRRSGHRDAIVRELRLLESGANPAQVFKQAQHCLQQISEPETQLSLHRICQRSARRAGLAYAQPQRPAITTHRRKLPRPASGSVEHAVVEQLQRKGGAAFHVENRLFSGLFALLFWPALFAPVRGAFFNPFQAGPADLFRPGFVSARQALIAAGFARLRQGDYRDLILQRLQQKQGTRCILVHWPTLDRHLVQQVLERVPAEDLTRVFQHLLLDLRHHCRGLPDLIHLPASGGYELIEVKGPGDRLQDHQRLWLEYLADQGIAVSVWHLAWED